MKRHYIIPATNAQPICQLGAICVGSVHSEEGLHISGPADPSNPEQKPF